MDKYVNDLVHYAKDYRKNEYVKPTQDEILNLSGTKTIINS